MISEGETPKNRQMAERLGERLNADYCFFEVDEHDNTTLVLKYGEFYDDSSVDEIADYILGE